MSDRGTIKQLYKEKVLDREIEQKMHSIAETENELIHRFQKTHNSFVAYISSLNLPQSSCQKHFPFLHEKDPVNLVYVYDPEIKGSRILSKENFEQESEDFNSCHK